MKKLQEKDLNFGKVDEYSKEHARIISMARTLRNLRGETETKWEEPAEWAVKYSNLYGKPKKALTITLTPAGCTWAAAGGCTMCGEFEGSLKFSKIPAEFHIAQFASAAAKYVKKYQPTWLRIEQEGNFINEEEVMEEAQFTILRLASLLKGIDRITIEARPFYITEKKVKKMKEALDGSDVELEIGMGLEAENDVIRNVCVNKGERKEDFERAVKLLNENGFFPLAYVLLKPPFLTEAEGICEAIKTIRYANSIGFKRISLEPMSLHKYTVVDALANAEQYQVPWLWSVLQVINECKDIPELGVGGVGYYPRPKYLAQNHHKSTYISEDCNKNVWQRLKDFSENRDINVFIDLECECQQEWKSECEKQEIPLKERINKQLNAIDLEDYKRSLVDSEDVVAENSIIIAGGTQQEYVRK